MGEGIADAIDPTEEDAYWRANHLRQPWDRPPFTYDDFAPAYRLGYTGHGERRSSWSQAERGFENSWDSTKGTSRLAWRDAKDAVRSAWHRVEERLPGDADGDGR